MNPLGILKEIDKPLFDFFESSLEQQRYSLSFIPDESATSPLCAEVMGSMLVNSVSKLTNPNQPGVATLARNRLCEVFNAENAHVKVITIEAASRVVFSALTKRGDVVMTLDMRKKEHCNSENLAFRFVNFGAEPSSGVLDYDKIREQALSCKPHLIIVSPINYPLSIDYKKFADIAKEVNAYLWCDISQTCGLVAGGAINSPLPYADVVTFQTHGAMQGPQAAVILSKTSINNAIVRSINLYGHKGLTKVSLAALATRLNEMKDQSYKNYCKRVLENAKALSEGLKQGGLKIVFGGTDTHLVVVDTKSAALAARGAQEVLEDCGISVRCCDMLTDDPNVKYEAIRLSSLPSTVRGITPSQMRYIGQGIAEFLLVPDEEHAKELKAKVTSITSTMPTYSPQWMSDLVRKQYGNFSLNLTDLKARDEAVFSHKK
ncbi:MAG TPA: hypothetical protein DCR21_05765 [Succinivibrionaceae bacterium]|nr:hypothetical protein [Succinivibrionaceae bacterium]